ncbi:MAG TPA: hypothetical protein VGM19_05645 [Armatimonadota bacterium]|jgi:hypothetical protein
MRTRLVSLSLLLLLTLAVAASAQDRVLLRYKFTAGETHSYDLNVAGGGKLVVGTAGGDMNVPMQMTIAGGVELLTREVDPNGDGHLGVKIGELTITQTMAEHTTKMTMDLNTGVVTMDGKPVAAPPPGGPNAGGPAPAAPGATPGEALGKLTLVMSPQGAIVGVQGLEEFLAAMQKIGPGGAMNPMMKMMPSLEDMAKSPQFPADPVRVGDTWTQEWKLPLPGQSAPLPLTYKYTLEKLGSVEGRRIACLGLAGEWEMKDLSMGTPVAGQPAPPKVDRLTQKLEGQLYFDMAGGFVDSAHFELTMNMDMTVPVPAPPPPPPAAEGNPPNAGGAAPEAAPTGVKVSLQDLKLNYDLYPHGGESLAGKL